MFNVPWFNASIGINAPKYILNNDLDVTDVLEYPEYPSSYIIWNDTSTNDIYAKNCTTGQIDFGGSWDAGGVDGTNATTVIQAVIDDLASGKIFVRDGTYSVSSLSLENKDNLVLEAESWNTKLIASGDLSVIVIGRRQEAAYTCTNIVVSGFYIDGSAQTAVTTPPHEEPNPLGCGIEVMSFSEGIIIEKNYIYNTGSDSIYGESTGAVLVRDNTVNRTRAYYASIHPHSISEWTIIGNYIYDSQVEGIRHGHIIQGNFLSGIASWGIMGGDKKSTIVGNWMDDVFVGINIYRAGTVVSGNRMYGTGDVAGGYGIVVRNEPGDDGGSQVICNQIENFYTGIINEGSSVRAIIIGNRIENSHNFGIVNSIDAPSPIIIGNQITNSSSDGILRGTNATIIGNVIDGVTTFDGIRDLGDGNIVKGNQFLNINRYSIKWADGSVNNTVTGNHFSKPLNNLPTTSIIKDNIGYVTENSGTQTCADNENIAHGLVGIPTFVSVTPMNDTYNSVAVIATVDWSNVDATNLQVGLYWINGTAISDDIILVSWRAEYDP